MKTIEQQVKLAFDGEVEPHANLNPAQLSHIKWSYSRRGVLEQCPRRYYYEYYASTRHGSLREQDEGKIRLLKSLQNRHERTGALIHLVISTFLRRAKAGDVWSKDRLCKWARDMFRRDIAYSKTDHKDSTAAERAKYQPVYLQEFYYRDTNAMQLANEAEARLIEGLRVFSDSDRLAEYRSAGIRGDSLIECSIKVPGLPCQVSGKLDLGFRENNRIRIVDWKLGEASGTGEESLQLAVYALDAVHRFAVEADDVEVAKAHLTGDVVVHFPVSQMTLRNARARIVQDAERMCAMHDYGMRGIEAAFTACAQPGLCGGCSFREICPEGRATINA